MSNIYCSACDKYCTVRSKGGLCWDCLEAKADAGCGHHRDVARWQHTMTKLEAENKRLRRWKAAFVDDLAQVVETLGADPEEGRPLLMLGQIEQQHDQLKLRLEDYERGDAAVDALLKIRELKADLRVSDALVNAANDGWHESQRQAKAWKAAAQQLDPGPCKAAKCKSGYCLRGWQAHELILAAEALEADDG